MKNNYYFLAHIVNTAGEDDERLPTARRLFRELCVETRVRQKLEDGEDNEYMPPIPKLEVKRMKLSEVVKTAMRYDIIKFAMTFAP